MVVFNPCATKIMKERDEKVKGFKAGSQDAVVCELDYHEFYIKSEALMNPGKKSSTSYKIHALEVGETDRFACNKPVVGYESIGFKVKFGTDLCANCVKARPELRVYA